MNQPLAASSEFELVDPEPFFVEIADDLVGALTLHCGSRAVGEELAQEAMARAWATWDRVSSMRNPRGWVFRVGFNLSNSRFRRRRAERRAYERHGTQPVMELVTTESIELRQALHSLSPAQRETIVLRFFLQFDTAETAETLGVSTGTVKTHTHRGLARLRDVLDIDFTTPQERDDDR